MFDLNSDAIVTTVDQGVSGGGAIGMELLNNGMNFDALRVPPPTRNTAYGLAPEEWAYLNEQVIDAFQGICTVLADFTQFGLVKRVDGMAMSFLRTDKVSNFNAAEISMDARTKPGQDRPEFTPGYTPLPFIYKDYSFPLREINTSRRLRTGIDATAARLAAVKVAEKINEMTLTGLTYVVGGQTLYGIVNHGNVNSVTLSTYGNWDASSGTGARVLGCVNALLQASINDMCYGPWGLYIPTAYATVMNYKAGTYDNRTVGELIKAMPGFTNQGDRADTAIKFIRPNAKLAANTVALVPLDPNQVQLVEGLAIQNIPWMSGDGFTLHNRVISIYAPLVRADVDGNTGIAKAA